MFGDAIEGLARLGRQAMVALVWVLLLIALALATWANIATGRAKEFEVARPEAAGAATGESRVGVDRVE